MTKTDDPTGDYFMDINEHQKKIDDKDQKLAGADFATVTSDVLDPKRKTDEYDDLEFYAQIDQSQVVATDKEEDPNKNVPLPTSVAENKDHKKEDTADSHFDKQSRPALPPAETTHGNHNHNKKNGSQDNVYNDNNSDAPATTKEHHRFGVGASGSDDSLSLQGYCSHTYTNGDHYEGEWSQGERHGQGTLRQQASGQVLSGSFCCNKLHGHGAIAYPNGDRFEGEFKNGVKHGHGVCKIGYGTVVEGEWINGLLVKIFVKRRSSTLGEGSLATAQTVKLKCVI